LLYLEAIVLKRFFILKTAVEYRLERPTVSNQNGLQTLKESPFWSDAEQCKVLPGYSFDAFPRSPTIKVDSECGFEIKIAS
jgi:hypothetical protein